MAATATLIAAISSLLWPLIAIVVLIISGPTVIEIIRSAKSRKFTLKIGGQELSMDEVSEQQRSLISDLQSKVAEIRNHIGAPNPAQLSTKPTPSPIQQLSAVLWVDDDPKNNSYFIDTLNRMNVQVDLAPTTADGLAKFAAGQYSVVISDMGRREDGRYNRRAGLDLLKVIRNYNAQIPFFIFCSERGAEENREEAMQLGANGITASATELYALLNLDRLQNQLPPADPPAREK
jgi:CheY-like chemotaxis protein